MPRRHDSSPLQLLGLAMLWASTHSAQADFGYANSRCEYWLSPEKAAEAPARRQWVLGYLSATMRFSEDHDLSTLDPSQAIEQLQTYCAAHPRESLETAALEAILTKVQYPQ